MKSIFKKELYYKYMIQTTDKDSIELYKSLQGEPEWIDWLNGRDVTDKEVQAGNYVKSEYNVETIFVINRYNDLAEWEGRVFLHPDWVERIKE